MSRSNQRWTLVIGDGATIDAEIHVGRLSVSGTVRGVIYARERVEIHAGARLQAEIHTPSLLVEDGAVIQKFVAAGLAFFVSTSFSKSFSLYGERVGALSVLCQSKEEADRVLSQLKIAIRTNYSNPPIHGGAVVAAVLNTPELRALWEKELGEMRVRIKAMRSKLVDGLKAAGVKQDMSFMTEQIGMFSYSGLSKEQMLRLRSEFGVYGTDTGRICVAALNSKNIDYVCQAIAKVI